MPQSLIQQQKLTQEQIQLQSAMQVLAAKLTELPLEGLLERVKNELNENPYLESTKSESGEDIYPNQEESSHDTYDPKQDYSSDEDIPEYLLAQSSKNDIEAEGSNIDFSDSQSFYEQLMEQAREYKLTEHERQILEYIIGNLDDDGLLSKPLYQLSDELQIYHYCDATIEEMERMLQVLWQFEPAGVGARSLQECLIIQCKRKGHHHSAGHTSLLLKVLEQNWNYIKNNRWDLIATKHNLSQQQLYSLRKEIKRLNPRPGSAMGEKTSSVETHITPDIIVGVNIEGAIECSLNESDMPTLTISEDANELLEETFVRDYVNRGQLFIAAITQRRHTILRTMQAIIKLQRQYFLTGDENLLRPMRLEDVSHITQQDLSTVSRVCNSKYVETPYGIHPLRWFFSTATQYGEEDTSIRQLHQALKDIIEQEDKNQPLTDDAIAEKLAADGFDVARRTVAKYREQLGIPTSRMRRL